MHLPTDLNRSVVNRLHSTRITKINASLAVLGLSCLYILLTPLFDLLPAGVYNEKRILELLLLLSISLTTILSKPLRSETLVIFQQLQRRTQFAVLAIPCLGLLSTLFSAHPEHAILNVALYSLLGICCFIIAAAVKTHSQTAITMLILTVCAVTLAYLSQFIAGLTAATFSDAGLVHAALFGNFAHIRFFSQFQSWTLMLTTLPLLSLPLMRNRLLTALVIFIAAGGWFMALSSGTRGMLLGSIIAITIISLLLRKHAASWLKWTILSAALGLTCYLFIFILLPMLTAGDSSAVLNGTIGRNLGSSSGRIYFWQQAWLMIQQQPLLGIGPAHYACRPEIPVVAHPHNSLLQIAAEWGLPVAITLLAIFIKGNHAWLQRIQHSTWKNNHQQIIAIALFASLLTASIHALFSGIMIMPLSQVLMITIIGTMLGLYFSKTQSGQTATITPPSQTSHNMLIAFLTLCIIVISIRTLPDMFMLEMLHTDYITSVGGTHAKPRFWQQGRLCDLSG